MTSEQVSLSVVICTHNPNVSHLTRTLDALRLQTLDYDNWELLVIDNASSSSVESNHSIAWHPLGRHVREDRLGLTHARLRGISESNGETIIFVDDDNILAPDYLKNALAIGTNRPYLAAWGGSITPEFEKEPPAWTSEYWGYVGVRPTYQSRWSNISDDWGSTPIGAGLVVRRNVAQLYLETTINSSVAQGLGRIGRDGLGGGEDEDLVEGALKLGYGKGVFPELCLTHIIPSFRLELKYLLRLLEQTARTTTLLSYKNQKPFQRNSNGVRFLVQVGRFIYKQDWVGLQVYFARRRGVSRALSEISEVS